jgi:hypothetical protein
MEIGGSIFLIVLGLILALAVKVDLAGLDIQVVGWILVGAGLVGIIMTFTIWRPRRRVLVERGGIVEETRVYDERPPL